MATFLQWVLPSLFLVIVMIVSYLSPVSNITPVIYSFFVGIVMFTLKSFLGIPDVKIIIKSQIVYYLCIQDFRDSKWIQFQTAFEIRNDSATGTGELSNLTLRVIDDVGGQDIPVIRRPLDPIGFRFRPHSVFPERNISFEATLPCKYVKELEGKHAEVRLDVVGQGTKAYQVLLKKT